MSTRVAAPPPVPLPDIAALLVPILPDKPSGDSLRFDAVYDDIKRLRDEDDPSLPQGVWKRELKRADWPGVAAAASAALAARSKDLQLATWLTEAWLKMHAFAGLAHGLRLVHGLCAEFWETLYPQIEDGNVDSRTAPIAWLAGEKFLYAVKSVPITAPAGEGGQAYAWKDWEATRRDAAQTSVLVSASVTPAKFFAALSRDATAVIAAIDDLKALLTERLGERDAPSLTPLRTALVDIDEFIARVRQDHPDAEEVPAMELVPQPLDDASPEGAAASAPAAPTGPIANRAEAYARLREAAEYLMRTEPHSPVPYLVRRAITWGNMSLADVLEQLMQKNSDLATIYTLLGIKPTENKGR